jgi:hypothetical protein
VVVPRSRERMVVMLIFFMFKIASKIDTLPGYVDIIDISLNAFLLFQLRQKLLHHWQSFFWLQIA